MKSKIRYDLDMVLMRREYVQAVSRLNGSVRHLALSTHELHSMLTNRDAQFGSTEESFRKAITISRSIKDSSAEVLRSADVVWSRILEDLKNEKAKVAPAPAGVAFDDALRNGYDAILQAVTIFRSAFARDALENLSRQPAITPEQLHAGGELLRAFITDSLPYYSTFEKLLDLTFGFSFDAVVLDRIEVEARRSMTLRALLGANFAFNMAMLAAETSVGAAEVFGAEPTFAAQ